MSEAAQGGRAARYFGLALGASVALAAAIRLIYVLADDRVLIGGDSVDYHFGGLRLADGLGYTDFRSGEPFAHHPPGWVTVLGLISWLGGRSLEAHQLVGVTIGLGVVVLAGLIGRRYFSARVGIAAAVIAALYPGFWVLEGNILSEPLGLVLVGLLTLAVIDLRDHTTLGRCVVVGATGGLLGLVRSEYLVLLPIVAAPLLLRARALPMPRRVTLLAVALVVCGLVISPWAIYNSSRFEEPVILSTNDGSTLLAGNCPPSTYGGARYGYFDISCTRRLTFQHRDLDRSQQNANNRDAALDNIADNVDRLPGLVPARFGRMLAVFRPSQTVAFTARWMTTGTKPIWAWIVSFWLLAPLAIYGALCARRSGRFVFPLIAPLLISVAVVTITYGEPRYHTPADIGVIVFAAVGVDRLVTRFHRRAPGERHVDRPAEQSSVAVTT